MWIVHSQLLDFLTSRTEWYQGSGTYSTIGRRGDDSPLYVVPIWVQLISCFTSAVIMLWVDGGARPCDNDVLAVGGLAVCNRDQRDLRNRRPAYQGDLRSSEQDMIQESLKTVPYLPLLRNMNHSMRKTGWLQCEHRHTHLGASGDQATAHTNDCLNG